MYARLVIFLSQAGCQQASVDFVVVPYPTICLYSPLDAIILKRGQKTVTVVWLFNLYLTEATLSFVGPSHLSGSNLQFFIVLNRYDFSTSN
jgi:hypothetical protein